MIAREMLLAFSPATRPYSTLEQTTSENPLSICSILETSRERHSFRAPSDAGLKDYVPPPILFSVKA